MNGIHEVTGSIPVWSTNLRSRMQAKVAHRSGSAHLNSLILNSESQQASL
jgi:hypothetical protein